MEMVVMEVLIMEVVVMEVVVERESSRERKHTLLGFNNCGEGGRKTSKATHIKLPQRGGPLYIFPRFLGERSLGASAKLAREEQQTRGTGKCFPRECLMSIALLSRFVLAFARL